MFKRLCVVGLVLSSCFAFTACGDSSEGDSDQPQTFSCLSQTCDAAAGQLCLFERYASTQEAHSAECLSPSPACNDCDCAEAAAEDYYGGSFGANCAGGTKCTINNGKVTVECISGGINL